MYHSLWDSGRQVVVVVVDRNSRDVWGLGNSYVYSRSPVSVQAFSPTGTTVVKCQCCCQNSD
jgi:hypothetical protein